MDVSTLSLQERALQDRALQVSKAPGSVSGDAPLAVSVVVPIYNEVESIPRLVEAIASTLGNPDLASSDRGSPALRYEMILVDDGSRDGSAALLKQLAAERSDLRVVLLRKNYGQTAAMAAGFNYALGDAIVTLDGDLQNDPRDIPVLLNKLAEGYDMVSGWRKQRQDAALTRLLPSKIANWLIGEVTGVRIHDYGCSLKAYRSELVADMNLYGELHRFLPALAFMEGARITELPVRHHARQFGQSKYGLGRTIRVIMDLLTIYFMKRFLTKPMHGFGVMGLLSILVGIVLGLYLTFLKFGLGMAIGDRPLLTLVAILIIGGVQLLCFGLLAELLIRTYHESQGRPIYRVREVVGGGQPTQPD